MALIQEFHWLRPDFLFRLGHIAEERGNLRKLNCCNRYHRVARWHIGQFFARRKMLLDHLADHIKLWCWPAGLGDWGIIIIARNVRAKWRRVCSSRKAEAGPAMRHIEAECDLVFQHP